jgi:hypothetical protein
MGAKWGWYQVIHGLAQGDILRFEAVTNLRIEEVLTYLAYENDLNASKNTINGNAI